LNLIYSTVSSEINQLIVYEVIQGGFEKLRGEDRHSRQRSDCKETQRHKSSQCARKRWAQDVGKKGRTDELDTSVRADSEEPGTL
jgi:hypothetical protein